LRGIGPKSASPFFSSIAQPVDPDQANLSTMNRRQSPTKVPADQKPKNKATMDQPQEEFIDSQSSHVEHDIDHGDELQYVTHSNQWRES
jgi:hypothetical protein